MEVFEYSYSIICPECKKQIIIPGKKHDLRISKSYCECCGDFYDVTVYITCPMCNKFIEIILQKEI
jgi:hypothetical protein